MESKGVCLDSKIPLNLLITLSTSNFISLLISSAFISVFETVSGIVYNVDEIICVSDISSRSLHDELSVSAGL
ncbi:hypothetical protein CANARDRAFT_30600 [[Candida] arabinofermentans NRRL YB-2248]|uniref:Uncharacterized protein n=1 Tax=[Candida] arabinofermentans NRRL YB-2248 TaxID=983967 RepID=A0A1E4STC4_9ASCO|nr:hypothetical protein CANARDRAFT_30600 [[Candida] arabinofermentans NRRL YB-2248]